MGKAKLARTFGADELVGEVGSGGGLAVGAQVEIQSKV